MRLLWMPEAKWPLTNTRQNVASDKPIGEKTGRNSFALLAKVDVGFNREKRTY
jgi:hypothetical protein